MAETGTLDTHRMAKRLMGAGMDEPQAEAVVDLIREAHERAVARSAFKDQLARLEARIAVRDEATKRRSKTAGAR